MLPVTLNYGDSRQLPTHLDWLSASEHEGLSAIRNEAAKSSWLASRFVAKQLLQSQLGRTGTLAAIEIYSRDGAGRSIRPQAYVNGRQVDYSLSISHSDGTACAALAKSPDWEIGVDLASEFRPNQGFLQTWLTASEKLMFQQSGGTKAEYAAEIWASKEAAFKAVNRGEPFEPAAFEVCGSRTGARSFCAFGWFGKTHGPVAVFKVGAQIAVVAACRRTIKKRRYD